MNACTAINEYEKVALIGEGTFGWVHHYIYKKTGDHVAIKKCKVNSETEGIPLATLREIALLSDLKHENIVTLDRVFLEPADKTLSLVFPLASNDLSDIIWNHHRHDKCIPPMMVSSFIWQMLNGINYLHQNWIVHRDLKPANVLLMGGDREKGTLKIADFGLARIFQNPHRPLHEDGRVVTIWYRAPELLLGSKHYSPAIDIWSLGCIFGEMLARSALFPGKLPETKDPFQKDQVEKVFSRLGKPALEGPDSWPEVMYLPFWSQADSIPVRRSGMFPSNHPARGAYSTEAFDLLYKMLAYNPNRRLTASETLDHKFFKTDPPIKNSMKIPGSFGNYQRRPPPGHRA